MPDGVLRTPASVPGTPLLTTRVSDAVWIRFPLLPITVSAYVPAAVLAPTVTARFDVPAPVTVAGVNVAVTPVGNPLTLSPTLPLKPFSAPTVTV